MVSNVIGLENFSETIQKSFVENDLEKARYIKRTGTAGNYQYVYQEPQGAKGKEMKEYNMGTFSALMETMKNVGMKDYKMIHEFAKRGLSQKEAEKEIYKMAGVKAEQGKVNEKIANQLESQFKGEPTTGGDHAILEMNGRKFQVHRKLDTSGGQYTISYKIPEVSNKWYWDLPSLVKEARLKFDYVEPNSNY